MYETISADEVRTLRHFLPEALHELAWVAGGAVTDIARCSDIDLWLIAEDIETIVATELKFLADKRYAFEPEPFYPDKQLFKIATIPYHPKDVQLLGFKTDSISGLLDRFDLSVHMHAISVHDGYRFDHVAATYPGQAIKVNRWTTPASTLRRYFAFCQRYGQRPDWDIVRELAIMMLAVHHRVKPLGIRRALHDAEYFVSAEELEKLLKGEI